MPNNRLQKTLLFRMIEMSRRPTRRWATLTVIRIEWRRFAVNHRVNADHGCKEENSSLLKVEQ